MTTTAEWRKWNAMHTKPITNYDLLIRKSPEELAEFFMREYDGEDSFTCPVPHPCPTSREASCKQCFLDWLKQEVEE